jgi:hypothetical protein
MQRQPRTRKTNFRGERSSVLKKDLTEPTLLEMSGLRCRLFRAYLDVLESQTFEQTCQRPARIIFRRFQ